MLHSVGIVFHIYSRCICCRLTVFIIHLFQSLYRAHMQSSCKKRCRGLRKLHLLINAVNKIDVANHKLGVNGYFCTEIIRD